jgi:hypothetical protein
MVNKVIMKSCRKIINPDLLYHLYVADKKSIPEISEILNECKSTIRKHLIYNNIPRRNNVEGVRLNSYKIGRKGIRKPHSDLTKKRMSDSRKRWAQQNAIGISIKQCGYYEITNGVNKGRRLHDVLMEKHIGRKLENFEVVHHINRIKTDNRIGNLQIMTKSDHSSLHARERMILIRRNKNGQFVKRINN